MIFFYVPLVPFDANHSEIKENKTLPCRNQHSGIPCSHTDLEKIPLFCCTVHTQASTTSANRSTVSSGDPITNHSHEKVARLIIPVLNLGYKNSRSGFSYTATVYGMLYPLYIQSGSSYITQLLMGCIRT